MKDSDSPALLLELLSDGVHELSRIDDESVEVATVIRKHQIHRVLVASPGAGDHLEVTGIISLFDLVSLLE